MKTQIYELNLKNLKKSIWEAIKKIKNTSHIVRAFELSQKIQDPPPLFHNNFSHLLNSQINVFRNYCESVNEGDQHKDFPII